MKQPTTSNIYPNLSEETATDTNSHNYRLQKISEIESLLTKERDFRKSLYKKYKRAINITDGMDSTLITFSLITASVGLAVPVLFPLEIVAVICGGMGVCIKFIRRKFQFKSQKHYEINTIANTKLNTIKDLISKALEDGNISQNEFKLILDELEKYNNLKDNINKKTVSQAKINEQDKEKILEEALKEIKKKKVKIL